jgi:O-antigen/teichoic acid export membrane protein
VTGSAADRLSPGTELDARASAAGDSVELLHGGAVNALATAVGAFRTVFVVLVARLLGDAAIGVFSLAWATIDLVGKVGGLGLGLGIVPLVARADGEGTENRGLLLTAVCLGLASSLALALAMTTGIRVAGHLVLRSPELAEAVSLMALALPGVVVYRISTGFSRGLRIMRHNLYSRGFVESLVTLTVFLAAFALGARALAPVGALVVGTTAGGAVAFFLALTVASGAGRVSIQQARHLIRHSLPVAGYGLVNLFMQRLDVLLLGAFVDRAPGLDLATFGAYCAAVEVANVMRRVRQTFEPIYTPVVARRMLDDDFEPVRGVVAQMGRWTLALQLPLAGVLIVSGGLALALFGPSFVTAAPWLSLLVVSHGLFNFFGLAESLLLVRRPDLNLLNSCVAATIQLGLSLLLVPRIGAPGAALAMIGAHTTLGALRLGELRRLFGVSWPWRSLVRPTMTSGVAIAAGLGVRGLMPGPVGWAGAALTLVAVAIAGWWALGLDAGDRATLAELRRRWRTRRSAAI